MVIAERQPNGRVKNAVYQGFIQGRSRQEIIDQIRCSPGSLRSAIKEMGETYGRDAESVESKAFEEWSKNTRGTTRGKSFYRTIEHRKAISQGKEGSLMKVLPLLMRGASVAETAFITSVKKPHIDSIRRRAEEVSKDLDQELIRKRQGEGVRIWHASHGRGKSELSDLFFAKKLYEAGFITADLTSWQKLHELYQLNRRKLPESFADRVRLEVFYIGMNTLLEKGKEKGGGILADYARLGKEVDEEWFLSSLKLEQAFIGNALRKEWSLRRANEDGNGNRIWKEPFLGGRDSATRAAIRARQRPGTPWLTAADKLLIESRESAYEQDDRGSDPRR